MVPAGSTSAKRGSPFQGRTRALFFLATILRLASRSHWSHPDNRHRRLHRLGPDPHRGGGVIASTWSERRVVETLGGVFFSLEGFGSGGGDRRNGIHVVLVGVPVL